MEILLEVFCKDTVNKTLEFSTVSNIANELQIFLNQKHIQDQISLTHKTHAKSAEIQAILIDKAQELGFISEKKGLFTSYQTSGLRPDYFKKLGSESGIIMEVERGKTTINNMDLLDLWKCHICKEANYLFLIVPKIRQTEKGTSGATFNIVVRRLQSFFVTSNYINVDGVFIFGY